MPSDSPDRRKYKRIQAPVLCRPVGRYLQKHGRRVSDLSLGGLRVYSDDPHRPGERLEMELSLPDNTQMVFQAEVVWVDALPDGAPAKFDIGLRYIDLAPQDLVRLAAHLKD